MALLALILAYTGRFSTNKARRIRWLALGVVGSAICYLAWYSLFSYKIPTNGEIIILGCSLTHEAMLGARQIGVKVGSGCPGNFEVLLSTAQYDPWVIWTNASITMITMGLLALWFSFIGAFTFLVSEFVLSQRAAPALSAGDKRGKGESG
jgi:hypothetical protein